MFNKQKEEEMNTELKLIKIARIISREVGKIEPDWNKVDTGLRILNKIQNRLNKKWKNNN